jgi:hypothetical protein
MNFEPGDIVRIVRHWSPAVVGQNAEVVSAHSPERCAQLHPYFPFIAPGEVWYLVAPVTGRRRACPHSWLRRADPVPLRVIEAEVCA